MTVRNSAAPIKKKKKKEKKKKIKVGIKLSEEISISWKCGTKGSIREMCAIYKREPARDGMFVLG